MKESDSFSYGYYCIERCNNILVATLKGGWSEETAHAFCRDFKAEAEPLIPNKWGHLVYLANWELGVPGVDQIIIPLVQWCIDNNLTHAAHIFHRDNIVQTYTERIVQESGDVFIKKIFYEEKDAIAWLAEQGYTLD